MADQHTQSTNAKKDAVTPLQTEAVHESVLNQSVAPPSDKSEKEPSAASIPTKEREPSTGSLPFDETLAAGATKATPSSDTVKPTLADFHKEMRWERHGYQPVSFFNTVEEARASTYDLSKTQAFIDVRKGGFTADELAAVPDSAKRSDYYIGFAKALLEGVFTKQFWTSFDGIKKVFSAGLISKEVSEIRFEAAEWLLSKRGTASAASTQSSKESGVNEAPATTPPQDRSATSQPRTEEGTEAIDRVPHLLEVDTLPSEKTSDRHASSRAEQVEVVEVTIDDLRPARVLEERRASSKAKASKAQEIIVEDLQPGQVVEPLPPVEAGGRKELGAGDATPAPIIDPLPPLEAHTAAVPQNSPPAVEVAAEDVERVTKVNEKLDMVALHEIAARVQSKLEEFRSRIVPEAVAVRLDDPKGAQTVRQYQRYGARFNEGFAAQTAKVQEALDAISKLGLDQPHQAGVFKRKQEHALGLVDSLSFGQGDVTNMTRDSQLPRGSKLPDSMKDAITNATDIVEGIEHDLKEARRLVASARRANPTPQPKDASDSLSSNEQADAVRTGSVVSMPRLGRDLTVDPRKLEMMGHSMVDANISDRDLNAWYKMVMSEFVKSYVGTFTAIRKEIYATRMDGSTLNELQKEKFKYLADELGTGVTVSDLVQLDYTKFSLPRTEDLDSRFRRVMDASVFQRTLNTMKSEFSTALKKEIEKTPGVENSDTTYIAFKRQKFEKSGVTDFLRS